MSDRLYSYIHTYGILHREPYCTHDALDLTIARIAEFCVAQNVRRIERLGTWLEWNGYVWQEMDNVTPILDQLADTVAEYAKDIRRQANTTPALFFKEFLKWHRLPEDMEDKDRKERLEGMLKIEDAIASKLKTDSSRSAIMRIIGSHMKVDPDHLDTNKNKIVFRNGCYNCETGALEENSKEQYATLCIDLDYRPPNDQSRQNIKNYLNDLGFDQETIEYLQRSFGYAATGQGKEKRFWWFRGVGDTSKSTLINMVADCLGQYAMSTPSDMWCDKKAIASGHTEDIARLRGRRLVVADEFQKKSRFNGALVKKVTSGSGKISASRKGEKTVEFMVTFALFCASNYDCQMDQDDGAFINRLNTLTFSKVISPETKDKRFIENFLNKDENRLALLEWVLEGARKYCESGIGTDPVHIKSSQQEFLEGQISIVEQIEEIVELNSAAVGKKAVTLNAVMEALNNLQKATRQTTLFTKSEVSKAITTRFEIERTSSNGHSGFIGLSLKNEHLPKKRRAYDPALDWHNDQYDDYEPSPN